MKRKLLLFSLLLALMVPWAANAQEYEVQIGEGTSTTGYFPFYTLYNYSIAENLFLASELIDAEMLPGTVTSLSWEANNETGYEQQGISIWMANVSDDALTTTSHVTTDMTLVYTGSVTPVTGWNEFIFNEETFVWDGESNILIFCQRNNGTWNSTISWKASSVGFTAMSYRYQDSGAYDVTTTNTMYTSQTRPNIIIKGVGESSGLTCEKPNEVIAENLTTSTATILWTGGSGTYNVEYKQATEELWTSAVTNTTDTLVELTGLTPATNYQAKVQSVCVFDDTTLYSRDRSVSFITAFGIPLIEPFATSNLPTGWSRYSGLLSSVMEGTALTAITGYWNFGTSNGVFDSHARINNYSTSHYYWLVTPSLMMENNVELSFDLALTKYSGTLQAVDPTLQSDDKFVVLITTDGGTTWEILRQWDNQGSEYVYNNIACSAAGEYVTIDLSSYAGQNIAIAFYAESTNPSDMENTGGDNNLHIDNVIIDYIPSCPKPSSLAYSEVTGHTALLTWTPNGVGQTQWQICLNGDEENLQPVTSTDGTYTLEGLAGQTPYTVKIRAYCSETDQSIWSNEVSFTTDVTCVAPTAFTTSDVTNRNVKLSWTSEGTDWIVAYKLTSAPDSTYVEVPVTENPYILEGLAPETGYTVKVRNNCGEVDGLSTWTATRTFTTLVAYPAPNNVAVDSVFAYTAYLSWNERGTAQDWEVAYKLATDTVYTLSELTPDNHPFLLGDFEPLTPGTDYVFKVRSIYFTEEGDTASAWSNEVPFTTLLTCPAPTEFTVIDSTINAYGATLNWSSVYSDSWNVKYREPAYVDGIIEEFGTAIPSGWEMYTGLLSNGTATMTSATYGWNFGSNNGVFDNHARVNIYSNYQRWLVMPAFTVPAGIELSFDLALTAFSGSEVPAPATDGTDDKFIVLISTDDMATWTTLREWNNEEGAEYVYNDIANTATGEHLAILSHFLTWVFILGAKLGICLLTRREKASILLVHQPFGLAEVLLKQFHPFFKLFL